MNSKLYGFLREHAFVRWASLLAITLAMLASVVQLSYKEDIEDFLPLSKADRARMAKYQDVSGMNRLFIIFESNGNPEQTTEVIDRFVSAVEESDTAGWCSDLQATFDLERLSEAIGSVYQNIPFYLTEQDYLRMDSLLASPRFMDEKLEDDLNALMLPSGSFMSLAISRDPLGLFTPAVERLQGTRQMNFETYNGYVFTPGMKQAIVTLVSPFGSSETDKNAKLIALLDKALEKAKNEEQRVKSESNSDSSLFTLHSSLKTRITGGPQIAVGNAKQIMHDSILAVSLSAILILALLLYAFRSFRNIMLIALSVFWGWLFALGCMALLHDSVSMIVVGISSIIIGIAVNYPLHLISHVQHQPDIRRALREITTPLLVGNVTTVGAFLALVPLKSIALRDLGLFASFLLIGTILFVLIWLPHLVTPTTENETVNGKWSNGQCRDVLSRLASVQIERKKWLVALVAVLTLVFGYLSLSTEFDSDVSHINYMTAAQKEDMKSLSDSSQPSLPLKKDYEGAARRWNEWIERHPGLIGELNVAAEAHGFAEDAFTEFSALLKPISAEEAQAEAFDIASLHSSVADALSKDFNYVGWACSLIVFLFLWLSFRRIELAVISFIPMAVSWIWILGIMSLLGIKFNIVNIILATFIFGQGDDYTIFMTEGCISEYIHGRPVLASYKRSIILSALIMFIGIGTLIFAKHPALHSLAEVTIVGMFSVVLMAYLIPPLLFKWMMKKTHSDYTSKGDPL